MMKTYIVSWRIASQVGSTALFAKTFDAAVKYVKKHFPGAEIQSVLVKDFN